jgi:GT2 family glycosyltransferase
MTRAETFRAAGGFEESLPLNYNDVDYCLKLRRAGLRVVYAPAVELLHHEAVTKHGLRLTEYGTFARRWKRKDLEEQYYTEDRIGE